MTAKPDRPQTGRRRRALSGSTPPFRDAQGQRLTGAIAEQRWVNLGGVDQYILVRGRKRSAPLLVNVHGGPGMSERAFYRYHNASLEDDFIIAYWDQRGAGKSFDRTLDPATLSIDRMATDLTELVDQLLDEFGQSQILLLAHSWGTVLALEHMARRPETVAAYIGVGQVAHQLDSEREGYAWLLTRAQAAGDDKALRDLHRLGPPPWTGEQLLKQRRHLFRLGGFYAEPPAPLRLIRQLLTTPETGWLDLMSQFKAMPWSIRHLWEEVQAYDAFERHPRLGVPISLMLGRHDHAVSPRLSQAWLDALEAPAKEALWYESAGHMIPAEVPDTFNRDVRRIARERGLIA